MDGLPRRPEVDASLLFLQKLDEERVLNQKPKDSQHSLASSETGSSSTMDHVNGADRKRKRAVNLGSNEDGAVKRVKVTSTGQDLLALVGTAQYSRYDISQHLPAEVWQHIFTFLPPLSLGKLLCVNRLFHRYLDPASPFKVSAPDSKLPSSLPKLSPNNLWRASRRFHWPNMPSPLSGKSELDMWRFACLQSCQFCGQVDENDYTGDPLPWSRGPGNDIVSPIFQFFVASCGQCLVEHSVKEVDLLLSALNPSFVAAGAPMVFLTADLNVVPRQILRNAPIPTDVQLMKVFWPAQLESLQAELEDARRFGAAAAEEWIKGLESRGVEAIRDASRWDSWYLSGGVCQMRRRSSFAQSAAPSNGRHRDKAEQGGRKAAPNTKATHKYPTRSKGKDFKESALQAPEDVDTMIQIELSKLSDQIINGQWDKGRSIKKENCADFASQVLTYVHKNFYANSSKAKRSSTRRLTIEDMRWIFAQKIAPLTDPHGKEIFACNRCPTSRPYALQGVIQHYCQTHCETGVKMSRHWKAEWTAELPFKPASAAEGQSLKHKHTPEMGHDILTKRDGALAKDVAIAWRTLKSVQNIPISVRRYQELYQEPAPLKLLCTGKCSKVIAVGACLTCNVCKQKSAAEGTRLSKQFKLRGLAHHCRQTHERVDWPMGMVWVPDLCLSQDVRAAIQKNRPDEQEMDQRDPVPMQSRQAPLGGTKEANDAVTGPSTYLYPAGSPILTGEPLHLFPSSALANKSAIASGPNNHETEYEYREAPDRMMAHYTTVEAGDRKEAYVSSRSVGPRHAVPEPRSYPHARETSRQQIPATVEVRHTSRQPCTTRYYNPPMSSTAYHYAEPIRSYDRYDLVGVRNLPSEHYFEHHLAYRRQRTTPMPAISGMPAGNYVDTAPASRVYKAYPSGHQLVERVSREVECDLE
ncbi:hypothetical protein BBK36DRAFT_1170724 [Trichoderma citrinoviride]|uniref:Uncharacterized protein n=1 Tax=Trichoderma citrinoviride TaxID=58853 RepID=A0A2T4B492_9HYPO|nr:hypothetical protein BBK36DRAFT_1170724 [Trichoderma citrinoviride]PTB64149.1 hypothetical protein BBK36DRAFT_1170724 [Trichoderma citrinoviride]